MIRLSYFPLFLFVYFVQINAIAQIDSSYYIKADSLQRLGHFKSSIPHFRLAITEFEEFHDWNGYLECLERLSESHWRIREFEESEVIIGTLLNSLDSKPFDTTIHVDVKRAAANYNLGIIRSKQRLYEEALIFDNKALMIYKRELGEDSKDVAHVMNSMSNIFCDLGNYDSAILYYTKAIGVYKSYGTGELINLANTYYNISSVHSEMGSIDKAQEFLEQALEVYRVRFGPDHPSLAMVYKGLGSNYMQIGSNGLAIEYFNRELVINMAWYGDDHLKISNGYFNLAQAQRQEGKFKDALRNLDLSLEIRLNKLQSKDPAVAEINKEKGFIYSMQGNFDRADKNYSQALQVFKNSYEPDHPFYSLIYSQLADNFMAQLNIDSAQYYYRKAMEYGALEFAKVYAINGLAKTYLESEKYESAIELYNEAIALNSSNLEMEIVDNGLINFDHSNKIYLMTSFINKARCLEQLASNRHELDYLNNALSILDVCDHLVKDIRKTYIKVEDKIVLSKHAVELYEMALRISLKLFQLSDDIEVLNDAYRFMEKSKESVLLESIGSISAKRLGLIPDSVYVYEKRILSERDFCQTKLHGLISPSNSHDSVQFKVYEAKLFGINRSYDSLILSFENTFPEYFNLKYENEPIPLNKLQVAISV